MCIRDSCQWLSQWSKKSTVPTGTRLYYKQTNKQLQIKDIICWYLFRYSENKNGKLVMLAIFHIDWVGHKSHYVGEKGLEPLTPSV